MMGVSIRPFQSTDLSEVIRISEEVYGRAHPTAEEWRHAVRPVDAQPRHGEASLVAVTHGDEQVAGYGSLNSEPWMRQAGKRRMELLVDPGQKGRGIGSQLYTLLEDLGRSAGVGALLARVEERHRITLAFEPR